MDVEPEPKRVPRGVPILHQRGGAEVVNHPDAHHLSHRSTNNRSKLRLRQGGVLAAFHTAWHDHRVPKSIFDHYPSPGQKEDMAGRVDQPNLLRLRRSRSVHDQWFEGHWRNDRQYATATGPFHGTLLRCAFMLCESILAADICDARYHVRGYNGVNLFA